MAVAGRSAEAWIEALGRATDRLEAVAVGAADPGRVRVLVVTDRPDGPLPDWPGLELVQSLWHGVDALVGNPLVPDVPLARLVDPGIPPAMARFVARVVLEHTQRVDAYADQQAAARWRPLGHLDPGDVTVGVLGLGEVGRAVAGMVRGLLHPVVGWRVRPTAVPGVEVRTGEEGLSEVVAASDVLVNALPSTGATRHLLDAGVLAGLPDGATFVNVGRGDVVDEGVLLAGLDAGRPAVAHLDVFEAEPLPASSPLWAHPRVHVTPHVSGPTRIRSALPNLVANLHRVLDGEDPMWLVDRSVGY